MNAPDPVRVLPLVLTADDWPAAVRFYRDVLALARVADFSSPWLPRRTSGSTPLHLGRGVARSRG